MVFEPFDWSYSADSRIAQLPGALRWPALIVRNLVRKGPQTPSQYAHQHDGIATRHNDGFMRNSAFQRAYARAVQAAGRDYDIPYRVHQILWASRKAQKVPGDFVECGTGRGFLMSALLADFGDWGSSGRKLHLFDTFLSYGTDAKGKQVLGKNDNYATSGVEAVRDNFAEWPNVAIHQGDAFDTILSVEGPFAFVHIDMNFWEVEVFALRHLWPRMSPGAVLVLDDYAYGGREPQYEAMNSLAAELGFCILSTASGQGIAVK